ncbi:hypothetical protein FQR65_LT01988 [Abscondita terminalis]|nr:hypothetical protein FQR65_LT01988 [Abscondita terminalis]
MERWYHEDTCSLRPRQATHQEPTPHGKHRIETRDAQPIATPQYHFPEQIDAMVRFNIIKECDSLKAARVVTVPKDSKVNETVLISTLDFQSGNWHIAVREQSYVCHTFRPLLLLTCGIRPAKRTRILQATERLFPNRHPRSDVVSVPGPPIFLCKTPKDHVKVLQIVFKQLQQYKLYLWLPQS